MFSCFHALRLNRHIRLKNEARECLDPKESQLTSTEVSFPKRPPKDLNKHFKEIVENKHKGHWLSNFLWETNKQTFYTGKYSHQAQNLCVDAKGGLNSKDHIYKLLDVLDESSQSILLQLCAFPI